LMTLTDTNAGTTAVHQACERLKPLRQALTLDIHLL
jgi:hypothetical protein